MDEQGITGLLKELHRNLEHSNAVTPSDRKLLEQLADDIRAQLARSGTAAEEPTILGRVQGAITQFEASHPDLTAILARVSRGLADMGI